MFKQDVYKRQAIYEIGTKCIMHTIEPHVLYQIIDVLKEHAHARAFFKGKHEFFTHEPYDERFLYDHINNQMCIRDRSWRCSL